MVPSDRAPRPSISLAEATRVWLRIGLSSFGGPAGQIAVMHRVLVDEHKWVSEEQFLHALKFCTLLPGPEAQQLATYIGWLLHDVRGGLIAGSLFILPGLLAILGLSILYVTVGQVALVQAVFAGLKPAVLAIVAEALSRIARRALKHRALWFLAGAAFVALFFFKVPFPIVVLAAGLIGWVQREAWGEPSSEAEAPASAATRPARARTIRTVVVGLAIWWVPVGALALGLGPRHVLVSQAVFYSKAAVVTFGGAYAALTYVGQKAVEQLHWLLPGQMVDGLALAETTPGPLILVLQFVGFLTTYRLGAPVDGIVGGIVGSLVVVWTTFVPSFLFVLAGAPYMETLRRRPRLTGALTAITAAVVGVIANLAVWFALKVIFHEHRHVGLGPLSVDLPVWASVDWPGVLIALAALVAVFRFKLGILRILGLASLAGLLQWWL
ncbi:MAG: chromate efflux transporter, partial [Gemmatimonadota bacterium]